MLFYLVYRVDTIMHVILEPKPHPFRKQGPAEVKAKIDTTDLLIISNAKNGNFINISVMMSAQIILEKMVQSHLHNSIRSNAKSMFYVESEKILSCSGIKSE